jgi:hypothetical protein
VEKNQKQAKQQKKTITTAKITTRIFFQEPSESLIFRTILLSTIILRAHILCEKFLCKYVVVYF